MVQMGIMAAIASLPHVGTLTDGMAQTIGCLDQIKSPSMTLPAAQRAVMTARTSQGFSYTLKAPYEKAMQRYMQRPHAHNFFTLPCCRSCDTLTSLISCLQQKCNTVGSQQSMAYSYPTYTTVPREQYNSQCNCMKSDKLTCKACKHLSQQTLEEYLESSGQSLLQICWLHVLSLRHSGQICSNKGANGI